MDNKIIVTEKAKKTIQINPEFLKLNGNLKKNTTLKRKQKPVQNQKVETNPSLVKKKLIEKIQAFKNKAVSGQENRVQENRVQENRVQEQKEQAKEREKFNNEFNKSLDFLQSLSNKRKENKVQQRNKVQKVQQPVQQQSVQQQSVQQQSVQQQSVQQQSVQQKQPSIKNKTLKHGKIERTVHNEVINEILETELPPELSSIFRYPPQKNINFSIEDSISSESMQSEFIHREPIQRESIQSEPIQSKPMQSQPIQSKPIQSKPIQSQPIQSESMHREPIQSEPIQSEPIQSEPIQSDPILKEPAYSNLKNGSKPTFREWKNQTLKNHHVPKHKKLQIEEDSFNYSAPITSAPITSAPITYAPVTSGPITSGPITSAPITSAPIKESTILEELKEFKSKVNINEPITLLGEELKQSDRVKQSDQVNQSDQVKQSEQVNQYKKITTRTLKYKLGKRGKKVGVLIKNAKTRKIIQKEYALLKQKQISDIKNYLRSKNLLKIGSDAPNDVLRQMYEQAILSGEVENKAGETLIHNFMHA